jgi:Fe-S cluster assembly protein SufD
MNAVLPTIDARRAEALAAFRVKGVPHRRIEEWKYSDLRSALDDGQVEHAGFAAWDIDSLPMGVELFDLAKLHDGAPEWVTNNLGAVSVHGAMDAASLAFDVGGLALRVSQPIANPVRLTFSTHGNARLLIVLAESASLTLVENHTAGESGLRNVGAEFVLGASARLDHIRLAETADAVHIGTFAVMVESGAQYHGHYTNFGARLSRVDANIVLNGEGAEAHLSGVDVLTDATHADVTTHMDHSFGNTTSTQLFKKVAGGKAKSIYQGKVTVRPGANGSDSRQTAKGLLLSDRAEIDLKPELEIFADDVKCAHGAAVGDLDTDSLFYLRSRGIPEAEARNMLVHAFLADALEGIENETLRAEVWTKVEAALTKVEAA